MKNNETNIRIPELTRGEEEIMQILCSWTMAW